MGTTSTVSVSIHWSTMPKCQRAPGNGVEPWVAEHSRQPLRPKFEPGIGGFEEHCSQRAARRGYRVRATQCEFDATRRLQTFAVPLRFYCCSGLTALRQHSFELVTAHCASDACWKGSVIAVTACAGDSLHTEAFPGSIKFSPETEGFSFSSYASGEAEPAPEISVSPYWRTDASLRPVLGLALAPTFTAQKAAWHLTPTRPTRGKWRKYS